MLKHTITSQEAGKKRMTEEEKKKKEKRGRQANFMFD